MTSSLSILDVLGRMLPPLLVIVGALLLLRRFGQRGRGGMDTGVRVLARTGVTRSAVVAVIQVAERRFLVGAGDAGVRLLAELPPVDPNDPLHPSSPHAGIVTGPITASRDGQPATRARHQDAVLDEALPRPVSTLRRPWIGPYRQLQALTVRTRIPEPFDAGSSDAAFR